MIKNIIRNGTAAIFLFSEPLNGWRFADAQEHRTREDWAKQIKWLLDEQYPNAIIPPHRNKNNGRNHTFLPFPHISAAIPPASRCLSVVVDVFPFVLNRESVNDFLVVVYHFLFDSQLH